MDRRRCTFTRVIVYACWLLQLLLLFSESVPRPRSSPSPPQGTRWDFNVPQWIENIKVGGNTRNRQWDNGRHSPAFVNVIPTRRDEERGVPLIIVLFFLPLESNWGKQEAGCFSAAMKYLGLLSMITWLFLRTFAAPLSAEVTRIFKSLAFIWLFWLFIGRCAFLLPWLFLL